MPGFPLTARVTRSYRTQYPDPIVLEPGDIVHLGERDPNFPGWIWGTSAMGKSGWIPEHFLDVKGDTGAATQAYDAHEIDLDEGEIVSVMEELLGWALVEGEGKRGWIPSLHLARSFDPVDLPL
jgi:Variant SH3 domain